ncbi:MAG: hypothetical protein IJJ38_00625 [Lachnospiraceae bacterium]|nr:hypothetical protein [Lachnospiraceae bacterium]
MKHHIKEWAVRIVILMIGLTIAHLGVTLFLLSDLGSDPFNVLVQGIYRTLAGLPFGGMLTHGRTHIGISLLMQLSRTGRRRKPGPHTYSRSRRNFLRLLFHDDIYYKASAAS